MAGITIELTETNELLQKILNRLDNLEGADRDSGDGKVETQTLSTKEAAKYLGISYWKLLEKCKKGQIPFIRTDNGGYLFRRKKLDTWMENLELQSMQSNDDEKDSDVRPEGYGHLRRIAAD